MHSAGRLTVALGVACLLAGCGRIERMPDDSPAVTRTAAVAPEETYDVTFMQGAKVGYTVTRQEKARENGRDVIRITSQTKLTVRRFGGVTEQEIFTTSVETPAGELVRAESRMLSGQAPNIASFRPEGNQLNIEVSTQGSKQTAELPWKTTNGGFFAVEQSLRAQPLKAGERRKLVQLFPLLNQVVDVELEAKELESTKMLEGSLELLKVRVVVKARGQKQPIESWAWCDAAGETLKTEMPDYQQVSYRTTKSRAIAQEEGPGFDLGKNSVVKVKRTLEKPHDTRLVVYRVHLAGGNPAEVFPKGVSQAFKDVDKETIELTVRSVRPTDPAQVKEAASPPTPDDLTPNNYLQSDNPRVVKMAEREAAGETDPWRVAVALEKLVHRSMKNRDFSQAFATAAEAAESLDGDCTEHAMLLAALCRVRKIPARVATGLVYFPPQSGFAFHMWTEVWINDRWVPLDATLGRGGIGAAHIKLAESNLKGADALATFLPVGQVMGRLELEIVAVE